MTRLALVNLADLAKADIITVWVKETSTDYLLYGRDALRRVRDARNLAQRTGRPYQRAKMALLHLSVKDSDEMDELAYAVEMMKTYASPN